MSNDHNIDAGREDSKGDRERDGISHKVAAHYNEIRETGVKIRKESRIYYMRNFNNWTKSMLIQEYVDRLNDHHGRDYQLDVLDMGCGKGGDLLKWQKAGINHITMVDIAEVSVEQARSRYRDMSSRNRGRVFSAEFFSADCTRARLGDMYRGGPEATRFDLVSCQFAFHYCFETEEQAECMLRNASECLSPGGFFIGTTPDAEAILKRMGGGTRFGNDVYSVEFDADSSVAAQLAKSGGGTIRMKDLPSSFGNRYHFRLEGVVDCPEFLVDFDVLTEMAERHGLMLVGKQQFENFFKAKRNARNGSQLLHRIKALELYPPMGGVPTVADKDSYKVAQDFIDSFESRGGEGDGINCGEPVFLSERDRNKRPLRVGTMSREEWEALTIYLTFAFKKKRQ